MARPMKKSLARLLRDRAGQAPQHAPNVLWDVIRLRDGRLARLKGDVAYNVSGTRKLNVNKSC